MNESPLVALVGLPNSGKSTLLNRITGGRNAITAKEAHTTRDLNYGEDVWDGMYMRFVDTGGLVPDPEDKIQREIQIKSWTAISEADILVWVMDRKQNPETVTDTMLQRLWKTGKPFLIAINKVDNPNAEKDISEYARFGAFDFINLSATTSYNVNVLLDALVEKSLELGFEKKAYENEDEFEFEEDKKGRKMKEVRKTKEGDYYVVRENSEDGPGLYSTVSSEVLLGESVEINPIKNIILNPESFLKSLKAPQTTPQKIPPNPPYEGGNWKITQTNPQSSTNFDPLEGVKSSLNPKDNAESPLTPLMKGESGNYKFFYLSDESKEVAISRESSGVLDDFEDGVYGFQTDLDFEKGVWSKEFFDLLIKEYRLNPEETVFVDYSLDRVEMARELGLWGVVFEPNKTDLESELKKIKEGKTLQKPKTPKILLLGKPNVGKSSLLNAMLGKDLQIVTEIPGTTLSVNDYVLERKYENEEGLEIKKKYVLLDSTGIRKSGQRTLGVETFATYRTIQASYEADVICLILDASKDLTHQDQVVAGVCKEANKGLVVIANKADIVDEDQKKKFLKDFKFKLKFSKVDKFIWISAKEKTNLDLVWEAVDDVLEKRVKDISREEVRKLFNYLMKKRPPNKLRNKKKPIIYDLLYTRNNPPTFELLVKDKTTLHWSYLRFLENIIQKQFNLKSTGVKVVVKEVDKKKVLG